MTVSLNTVTSNAAYQPYVPTVAPASSAAALSSQAVSLSAQSAVVASLGGSTGATVYTPSGLLTALRQAGTVEEPVNVPQEGIVATLANNPSASGIYTGAGTVTGALSEQAAANWAELLKTHPNLASTVISSSYGMGVISSFSVTA